ncbi:MAG: M16 family metallopeptidase [Thermoanaerobaculia bacterium]
MLRKTMLTIAVALFGATAVMAQKEAPPAPAAPKNFTIPKVTRLDLSNGMKVRLVPWGDVPKVAVVLVTQTGKIDEGANDVWLSDLTTEMLQQGTTSRSAADVALAAAKMGGDLTVTTGLNQTRIGADVLAESGPALVDLIADVARNPKMPATELARLKGDLSRRLSIQRSQPQAIANEKFLSTLFPNSSYGRLFPTPAMIDAYTADQVRGFYDRNFGAARSVLYVAGRFDAATMEKTIRRDFGDWKAGSAATKPNVLPVSRRGLYLIDRPGAVQSTLYIGLPTIDPTSPDFLPLIVTNALLGGSFGSRITSNIREAKGYTYSPFSQVATRLGAGSWAEVADVTTNVTGPSIKEILGEIDRLRADPPTDAELRGIQNFLAGVFVLQNASRNGINNQLAFLDLYGLGEDYLRNYVQRVYAVTPADVQRLTQRYIDPSKLAIVVAGDKKVILDQLKPYGDVLE